MDINLARTFLMVAETGSFIDAARKMNVTQSTVSARIKSLEDLLGRPLFERSKNGAELTSSGSQFQKHALALVRVWQHAQLEIGLSATHRDHLSVAAPLSLWHGFLSQMGRVAASRHSRHRGDGERRDRPRAHPTPDRGNTRPRGAVPDPAAPGSCHRASIRRGTRARLQRQDGAAARRRRLRLHRLVSGIPGGPRERLPRACEPGPRLRSRRDSTSTTC